MPAVSPIGDHRGKQRLVHLWARRETQRVRFALIPQRAAHRVGNQRRDHPVEQGGGSVRGGFGVGGVRSGGEVGLPRRVGVVDRSERRVRFERGEARPRFGERAAPRALDQPDGHAQIVVEPLAEEVSDGGEGRRDVRLADRPREGDRRFRFAGDAMRDAQEADLRVVGDARLVRAVARAGERPFHVRLPRTEPHLADQHIAQDDAVFALDGDFVGTSGVHRIETYHPFAVVIGTGTSPLIADADDHRLADGRRSPDGDVAPLLQYHVVAEQRHHADVRECGGMNQCEDENRQRCPEAVGTGCCHVGSFLLISLAIMNGLHRGSEGNCIGEGGAGTMAACRDRGGMVWLEGALYGIISANGEQSLSRLPAHIRGSALPS